MRRLVLALAALLLAATPGQADMFQDASNSKTDTAFRFGTGLYPQYATATTTTATTTSGVNTITVANPAGIVVGDVISATSPNFISATLATYVTAIAGNTVTISPAATSTQTGASVTFGVDRWVPGKTVMTDILGVRKGYFGAASKGHSDWSAQYFGGMNYPSLHAVHSVSESGAYAGSFATRASDSTGGPDANVIALGTLAVHDGTEFKSSWNQYNESRLNSSVPGQHIQNESTIVNHNWTPAELNPYQLNASGGSVNLRLDCGNGSIGGGLQCSTPLQIANIGGAGLQSAYRAGIMFNEMSVAPVSGLSSALQLPQSYAIDWFYPGIVGNKAWRIYSSATNDTSQLNLGNQGVVTQSSTHNGLEYKLLNTTNGNALSLLLQYGVNAIINLTAGVPFYIVQNGVTHLIANGGITQVTGLAVPAMATSCTGGISGTLYNAAGTVKICP